MFPQIHIDGFEGYWRRRKPGSSTAVHYASDVRIFFKWVPGRSPGVITTHDVDDFIEWQQSIGRATATIRRRLIALRMFFDYLAYVKDQEVPNPVIPRRHYLSQGHNLPRSVRQNEVARLFPLLPPNGRRETQFRARRNSLYLDRAVQWRFLSVCKAAYCRTARFVRQRVSCQVS